MDVVDIRLGADFVEIITKAVTGCQVLLAVIGPRWLTASDAEGRRRLNDPDDMVRLEIQVALEHDIPVIPILVEGAAIPRHQELPESLAKLPRRNGLTVRAENFREDAELLLTEIERLLRGPTGGATFISSSPPQAWAEAREGPIDAASHGLGIAVPDQATGHEQNHVLIPEGAPIPSFVTMTFQTVEDNQTGMVLRLNEGDDSDLEFVREIATCHFLFSYARPKGRSIRIILRYTADQLIEGEAYDEQTGEYLAQLRIPYSGLM